jgi:SAM-dependent methyltransferase
MDDYWQKFWAVRNDPLHSDNSDAYNDRLAAELCMLLPKGFQSFFDIGCGNGVLYKPMGLDKVSYQGVDYSASMIEAFKAAHPDANVSVANAEEFLPDEKFDVVFSHGVLQNIRFGDFPGVLKKNIANLSPGGSIIHAGVLWDRARTVFESGVLQVKPLPLSKRVLSTISTRIGVRRGPGHWYSMKQMRLVGQSLGLESKFYGSLLYPYRFHIVFTRRGME